MMASQAVVFLDLPWNDVIFQHVLPCLSLSDLCHLRAASKNFLHLCNEYMSTCRKLDLSGFKITDELLQRVTALCQSLRWLSVHHCSELHDQPLMDLFRNNPKLTYVDLSGCRGLTGTALQVLVVQCRGLRTLLLDDCPWVTEGHWQLLTFHQSQLQRISVAGCWSVDEETLGSFFRKFPGLQEVGLSRVERLTDACLHHLALNCPALHTLNISYCWRVTDQGLSKVVEYCPQLKRLTTYDCKKLSDKYLCSLCVRGLTVESNHSLSQMVKRRRHVDPLQIKLQI